MEVMEVMVVQTCCPLLLLLLLLLSVSVEAD